MRTPKEIADELRSFKRGWLAPGDWFAFCREIADELAPPVEDNTSEPTCGILAGEPEPIDMGNWSPIDSAPTGKKMFLVIGVFKDRNYITDQYAVWRQHESNEFTRWPHQYPPTHWHPLPDITCLEELLV